MIIEKDCDDWKTLWWGLWWLKGYDGRKHCDEDCDNWKRLWSLKKIMIIEKGCD